MHCILRPHMPLIPKTPRFITGAPAFIEMSGNTHAAIVAWACSLHGPRSPVGLTHRIHT